MLEPDVGVGLRAVPDEPASVGELIVGRAAEELALIAEADASAMLERARAVMLDVACELDELVAGGAGELRGVRDRLRAEVSRG